MTWLSIFMPAKRFLGALGAWLGENPWRISLIVIAALSVSLWAKSSALDSALTRIAMMKQASEKAEKAQRELNAARATAEKDIANEADLSHADARLEGERRAIVYRDRWRVRNVCAAGATDSAAADPVAPHSDRPRDTADMVAVSERDFNACTANSLRVQAVNQWGERLIDEGLVVASDNDVR